jgi:hypothetical protein
VQTENEKAVRTLFEQWWNDKCANMPILDYGYQTLTQDIAFHAFKAALQSQVSNTPQDGRLSAEVDEDGENQALRVFLMGYGGSVRTIEGMRDHLHDAGYDGHWPEWAKDSTGHLTKLGAQNWIRHLIAMEQPPTPPQQEQSGEAVARMVHDFPALSEFFAKYALGPMTAPSCLCCGRTTKVEDYAVRHAELPGIIICRACKSATETSATPTATASQESAPGQEAVALTDEQVDRMLSAVIPGGSAARDWFLPHEHQRGLENVRGVVRAMYAAAPKPPTATAIAAMVIRQAAELCEIGKDQAAENCAVHGDNDEKAWKMANWLQEKILALTTANAETELEASMMKVGARAFLSGYDIANGEEAEDVPSIVRRVLDEKGE